MMDTPETQGAATGTVPRAWHQRKLGTFATKIGSGATPRGGAAVYLAARTSHALIRSQHVFDRRFDTAGLAYISSEHSAELRNAEVQPDDVLLNITGDGVTFGRACIVPNVVLPACVNQHVAIIRVDQAICAPGYLLAFLTHPMVKRYMESFNTGGSRRAITKGHIESFEIPLPPLPVQRRIAGILSAYDDLIENCERRISVLDEMARTLYREWFVLLRYPGHEDVPLVDSPLGRIPKGWTCRAVKDLATVTYGFTFASASFSSEPMTSTAMPVVRIRDILDGVSKTYTAEPADPRYLIKNDDILVGMDGEFHMCIWWNGPAQQNQRVARFEPASAWAPLHFFLALEPPIQSLNKAIVGTTVAHLGDMHIKRVMILAPDERVLSLARNAFLPLGQQISGLRRTVRVLRETRDILLPRLLSGQLAIEDT